MSNPVEYAENQLGVHAIWQAAESELQTHGKAIEELKACNRRISDLRIQLEDRERDVANETDLSECTSKTAIKETIKAAIESDSAAIKLRKEIATVETDKAAHDLDARHAKYGVELHSARLVELGGLLNFYAAAKTQANQAKGS